MASMSDDELSQLAALAAKAATDADRPAWARIMNDAAHVAELMASPPPTRFQDLDAIRRGVDEVKAELARKAQTAQARNTEPPERGSADTPTP